MKRFYILFLVLIIVFVNSIYAAKFIRNIWTEPAYLCPGQEFTLFIDLRHDGTNEYTYICAAFSANTTWENVANNNPNDWLFIATTLTEPANPVGPGFGNYSYQSRVFNPPAPDYLGWYTISWRAKVPTTGFPTSGNMYILIKFFSASAWLADTGQPQENYAVEISCTKKTVRNIANMGEEQSIATIVIEQCTTNTDTPTLTNTSTPTNSPTQTATFTRTNTSTATNTYTNTFTNTATNTSTITSTFTNTSTNSPTFTPTASPTNSPTNTNTFTNTVTGTPPPTWTFTDTPTNTNTFTTTFTFTVTNSFTPTFTFTASFTHTFTATITSTGTPPPTFTFSNTATNSFTPTNTFTFTATYTWTNTATITFTPTETFTAAPSPVELTIRKRASGDEPKIGNKIRYTILIENRDHDCAYNLAVWDTLPDYLKYSNPVSTPYPIVTGNYIYWDFTSSPTTVCKGGSGLTIEFEVELLRLPKDSPITNKVMCDYNDTYYFLSMRHPPVVSNIAYYPADIPVIYPNPFYPEKAIGKKLKIDNLVPGSLIHIYTVSGELVMSLDATDMTVYWDGKNRFGYMSSPGIYYWLIKTPSNKIYKGKLFIVNSM